MSDAPLVLDAHGRSAHAVHFTRDGKHLVSCGDSAPVRVWSVPGFRGERELPGRERGVTTLSFSADDARLATLSTDGTVHVSAFAPRAGGAGDGDGKPDFTLQRQALATLGPDGEHLVTVSTAHELALRDGRTGAVQRKLGPLDKRHSALAFAASGLFLFVGGTGPIRRIGLPDGTVDGVLTGHQIGVACLRPSPNPAMLASTGLDGTLRFWTVVSGAEVSCVTLPADHSAGALQLAFAPDGRSVALSTATGVLRLAAPDGDLIERHPMEGARGVAYSPDGRFLACAASDGRVRVWTLS
jgi:WD40 repeat protein